MTAPEIAKAIPAITAAKTRGNLIRQIIPVLVAFPNPTSALATSEIDSLLGPRLVPIMIKSNNNSNIITIKVNRLDWDD